jgi:hypothetical protein
VFVAVKAKPVPATQREERQRQREDRKIVIIVDGLEAGGGANFSDSQKTLSFLLILILLAHPPQLHCIIKYRIKKK